MVGRAAGGRSGFRLYPNAKKYWLVVKSEKLKEANNVFAGAGINITTEGANTLARHSDRGRI